MTTYRRGVVLRVLLVAALLAIVALVSGEVLSRMRGVASPEELVDQYVQAMRRSDADGVARLMPADREDRGTIAARMERYRALPAGASLEVEHTEHSVAA